MIIAIDFDGTIVEHRYPEIGPVIPGAFEWMKRFQDHGLLLMLWTMRSSDELKQAVAFCAERGITFWGVNSNPQQHEWTDSAKQYAHLYVDDAAVGCPLIWHPGARPIVDWSAVGPAVLSRADLA